MSDNDSGELPEEQYSTFDHHDRVYHEYSVENNVYFAPVDQTEAQRLQLMHDIFLMKFEGQLILPEPRMSALRRILDCGTGTAIWATEVAQRHPNCEVHAVDVSDQMMPFAETRPPNLHLFQSDLNDSIPYRDNEFDFVHSRMLSGGINVGRWERYLRDIRRVLVRNGWVQLVEVSLLPQSSNGSLNDDSALRKWWTRYSRAMRRLKEPQIGRRLGDMLRSAGFVEVEAQSFDLRMCGWSNQSSSNSSRQPTSAEANLDELDHQIGVHNSQNVSELLYSLALWPFTAQQG
ncbi:S-adenosyl-L-methionine-dependent methyltransferase [Xylariales sp. PMI_506]|nr:S-adenosyl-L-methionine-dependent methyltransferase [Xylariales sp. PMI_506]